MSSSMTVDLSRDARNRLLEQAGKNREDDHKMLTSLAAEIAMDINTFENILAMHCLSKEQFERIVVTERFQQLLREANRMWGSAASAGVRIKAKMESMLEQALPDLFKGLMKGDDLTPSKVQFVQAMMKGGGIGVDAKHASSEGVKIFINTDSARIEKPLIIEHSTEEA